MSTGLPPPAGAAARRPPSRRPLVRVAIDVPATAARLQDVHDALARFWAAVARSLGSAPPGAWRAAFETAVAEVAANIVRHAYPPGFPPGTMRFRLHAYRDAIEARFADHGVGFQAPPAPPAPGNDAPRHPLAPQPAPAAPDAAGAAGEDDLDDLLAALELVEGGYGLPLAQAALDTLDYHRSARGENEWRLVKRLSAPAATG
jgi:serine/threonine-protein kinase RsbW